MANENIRILGQIATEANDTLTLLTHFRNFGIASAYVGVSTLKSNLTYLQYDDLNKLTTEQLSVFDGI
jgi:hypothetical protein